MAAVARRSVGEMTDRPPLDQAMPEQEFRRWYWTMAELQPFARRLGVRASGPKADLTERIAAHLAGRPHARRSSVTPTASGPQLTGPVTMATKIPPGQRSTEELRSFFVAQIGPSFTFNGHMRAFLRAGDATLGDAVEHWYRTVGAPLPTQSESLEFNRFTRAWHASHPNGTAAECRQAWAAHRALPVDERPPVEPP